jgi:SPP1 family predicted phage head-tail adaptor
MNIGKLRHQVYLQSSTATANEFGENIPTWSTYATVWAEIKPLQGRELENAQQISEKCDYEVFIRYNSSVLATHRIVYGTRTFEINAVLNLEERNEILKLICTEIR